MFNGLVPCMEEKCMYSDLFLLKHMEILVKEIDSSKEIDLSIEENLITNVTDMEEFFRMDPGKVIVAKPERKSGTKVWFGYP